jgi:hypothetical protein
MSIRRVRLDDDDEPDGYGEPEADDGSAAAAGWHTASPLDEPPPSSDWYDDAEDARAEADAEWEAVGSRERFHDEHGYYPEDVADKDLPAETLTRIREREGQRERVQLDDAEQERQRLEALKVQQAMLIERYGRELGGKLGRLVERVPDLVEIADRAGPERALAYARKVRGWDRSAAASERQAEPLRQPRTEQGEFVHPEMSAEDWELTGYHASPSRMDQTVREERESRKAREWLRANDPERTLAGTVTALQIAAEEHGQDVAFLVSVFANKKGGRPTAEECERRELARSIIGDVWDDAPRRDLIAAACECSRTALYTLMGQAAP